MISNTAALTIRALDAGFGFDLQRERLPSEPGLELERLTFRFPLATVPARIEIEWGVPIVEIAGKWHPAIGADRSLTADWGRWLESYATMNAPVISLFSAAGQNRLTFAVSDAIAPVKLQAMVNEDTAEMRCRILLFDAPTPELTEYSVIIRRDSRGIDYAQALGNVADWWAAMPEYRPAPVPAAGFDPVYSTWYGFHQKLAPETIEEECRWARDLGCGAVIVDDGWQCDDNSKGYDYCGDWAPAASKFPDFPAHVRRIQALGMKYLLWFSVPYAGVKSEAWTRFQGRVLLKPRTWADCLDPRYKDVRDYLVECYRRAVQDWGFDGLKLDFVDRFTAEALDGNASAKPDMVSVPAAADRLLTDVNRMLAAIKPGVLIEFRQKYIGPAMRKYGHLFRANDCPADALSNRVRTLDVRLLAGNTAVHSDMIMWHPHETPEQVAIQLWSTLFSVPQISVRRDAITSDQERVLRFYLEFWRTHRPLLLSGRIHPTFPQELYPVVYADDDNGTQIIACYSGRVVSIDTEHRHRVILVNASERPSLAVEFEYTAKLTSASSHSWQGHPIHLALPPNLSGIHSIPVPIGGICELIFQT
ncbi:MAG: glycoside hydrolase family 36 protein [Opitutaceae bacterium]|jgi:alpha-galactosidase